MVKVIMNLKSHKTMCFYTCFKGEGNIQSQIIDILPITLLLEYAFDQNMVLKQMTVKIFLPRDKTRSYLR